MALIAPLLLLLSRLRLGRWEGIKTKIRRRRRRRMMKRRRRMMMKRRMRRRRRSNIWRRRRVSWLRNKMARACNSRPRQIISFHCPVRTRFLYHHLSSNYIKKPITNSQNQNKKKTIPINNKNVIILKFNLIQWLINRWRCDGYE